MAKIKVALRVRPLSIREIAERQPVVVSIQDNSAVITDIRVPERATLDSRQRCRPFAFDHAFWLEENGWEGASQEQVYDQMAHLEKSIMKGYNACLLAYGQSGTGKTHTMLGTKEDPGLIPRLCRGLWGKLQSKEEPLMEVSFLEIYREKARDLLGSERTLKLREHPKLGPIVQDLRRLEVREEESLLNLLWEGEARRAMGVTGSNGRSSRSHAIWTLHLSYSNGLKGRMNSTVHLVDLAGSEKAHVRASRNLLAEGADINRSLVSLGNVISSLAEKASYIPYRDSALTWLLKDSLGGNATTAIIITASPASLSHAQTLNSLRFAQRARQVENEPEVNVRNFGGDLMSTYEIRKDILRLSKIIRDAQTNGGILRGLTPRHGWNRLITAIEGFNDSPRLGRKIKRSSSEENTSTMSVLTSTASTMTTTSSSNAMVQTAKEAPASAPSSPVKNRNDPMDSKDENDTVFIPLSPSIKCLTWQQEEIQKNPLLPTPSFSSETEEEFNSPPSTPNVHHLKYKFPIRYPLSKYVDPEARINEKIHKTIQPITTTPFHQSQTHISDSSDNSPMINDQIPTFVLPSKCDMEENSFKFSSVKKVENHRFESTDSDEAFEPALLPPTKKYRGIRHSENFRVDLEREITSPEEALFFSETTTSSSSYESLLVEPPKIIPRTKIVENGFIEVPRCRACYIEEDLLMDIKKKRCVSSELYDGLDEESQRDFYSLEEPEDSLSKVFRLRRTAVDFSMSSRTKYENYFAKEFVQMGRIGEKIKKLQAMSEGCKIIGPYLDEIESVGKETDWNKTDEKLDAEIESCSGWNVDVEMKKIENDITDIHRLLRNSSPTKMSQNPSISSKSSESNSLSPRRDLSRPSSSSYSSSLLSSSYNPSFNPYLTTLTKSLRNTRPKSSPFPSSRREKPEPQEHDLVNYKSSEKPSYWPQNDPEVKYKNRYLNTEPKYENPEEFPYRQVPFKPLSDKSRERESSRHLFPPSQYWPMRNEGRSAKESLPVAIPMAERYERRQPSSESSHFSHFTQPSSHKASWDYGKGAEEYSQLYRNDPIRPLALREETPRSLDYLYTNPSNPAGPSSYYKKSLYDQYQHGQYEKLPAGSTDSLKKYKELRKKYP